MSARKAGWIVVAWAVAAGLLGAFTASAQEGGRLAIDQVVVAEDGDRVVALVSVLDETGRPVPGVAGFEAAIDGEPVPVESVEPVLDQDTGVAVLLMMDISGSMAGEPIAQSKGAAEQFVADLRDADVAGVLAFERQASQVAPFGASRAELLTAIASLEAQPDSGTALYASIARALEMSAGAPLERRAIVVLTDGQDNGSSEATSRSDVVEMARRGGVPFYVIALGTDTDRVFLEELASAAGGRLYEAATPQDVAAVYQTIGETLRGQYALTLPLPPAETPGRELLVGVELEGGPVADRLQFDASGIASPAGEATGRQVPWTVVGVVVLAAIALLAIVAGWRRLRGRGVPRGGPAGDPSLPPMLQDEPRAPALESAVLTVIGGPNAGSVTRMTGRPVEMGSGSSCDVRLDPIDGLVAKRHARAWLSGGRLILHHLARGKRTFVDDRAIDWAALDPGDTLQIGPHVVSFARAEAGATAGGDLPSEQPVRKR